jgi:hypothetical protein
MRNKRFAFLVINLPLEVRYRKFSIRRNITMHSYSCIRKWRKDQHRAKMGLASASTMQACRGCPVMGAAMSGSYERMLERARRAGAPRKPCWATLEVTGGGFIGPVRARDGL